MSITRDLDGRVAQGWGRCPQRRTRQRHPGAPRLGYRRQHDFHILRTVGRSYTHPGLRRTRSTLLRNNPAPTIILPKVAAENAVSQVLVSGAVQVGTGQVVLDSVAADLIPADQEHLIFVSVWIDPEARDETAVRTSAREAVTRAVREAVVGLPPSTLKPSPQPVRT